VQSAGSILVLTFLLTLPVIRCRADLWGISVDPYGTAEPGTEQNYNKVFRFDNAGNKLPNDIPSHSAGLTYPTGIAVGPDGNIYVSSQATGSILFYDGQSGAPLPSPQPGGPDGLFAFLETAAPAQLAFGPDGNLYVSEYFGTSVRVYDRQTGARLADAATGLTSAGGLAFTDNGDLLVGDGFAMAAGQTARIVRVHNGVPSTFVDYNMGVFAPAALVTLAGGDVLAVDLVANYIARFDANGAPLGPFAVIPPPIAPPGSNFPSDIAFDPDGNLVVSVLGATNPPDDRGALLRYDLNGNLIETIVDQLEPIGGIDWTPDPNTLLGDYDGNQSIGQADYDKMAVDFGKLVARGNGADGNANGIVDAADFVTWRKALSGGGVASPNGVPEPTTAGLFFCGLLMITAAGNRRRYSRAAKV
jgi:sugar lactone lactonase YvrE